MFVQIRYVPERFETESTLIQACPRVGCHMFIHGEPHGESLSANLTLEWSGIDGGRAGIGTMAHHMEFRAELFAAHITIDRIAHRVDHLHMLGQTGPTAHLFAAQFALDRFAQISVMFTFVRFQPTSSFEHFRTLFAHELLVRMGRSLVSTDLLFTESENHKVDS